MKSLNIIGAGRVGRTLGRLWHDSGVYKIQDVLTTSGLSAQEAVEFIGAGHATTTLRDVHPADVWLLAVPDRQIAAVAGALAGTDEVNNAAIAFHCSGAMASMELKPLHDLGWQVASAHCLLSFASPSVALNQFGGTPCALEGDQAAAVELETSFKRIGARCFPILAEHKLLYHAGAVFATNFLPVLQSLANQLWQNSGMPADLAAHHTKSLLQNSVDNIQKLGPVGALTGPAARGDHALVALQGQALAQWNPDAGQAYAALSRLASEMAASSVKPAASGNKDQK